jgi:hypothetical protein
MSKRTPKQVPKRGPKPEILQIDADWKEAISTSLSRGKPPAAKKKARAKKRR